MQKNLGYVIPHIVIDSTTNIGHWYLGPTPLGVRATGTIWTIGTDHYWYCDGTKTDYLAEIPTEEYNAEFEQLMTTYDGALSTLLSNYQTEYYDWYVTNTTAWQNSFTSWFTNIQLQLDQDVAGHLLTEINEIKEDIGNTDISTYGSNITEAIVSLGESVSDGKTLVANAITAKGIETATNATFEIMANNISQIETGKKSLILPANPEITGLSPDTNKLDIYWNIPLSEISISHYNIYTALTEPFALTEMQLQASVTAKEAKTLIDVLSIDNMSSTVVGEVTASVSNGILTLNGTATTNNGIYISQLLQFEQGCSYYLAGMTTDIPGSLEIYQLKQYATEIPQDKGNGVIWTMKQTAQKRLVYWLKQGYTYENVEIPITLEKIQCKHTIIGTNDTTCYIAVASVSIEDYENASIAHLEDGIIGGLQLVGVGSNSSNYCHNKMDWYSMTPTISANDIVYGNGEFLAPYSTGIYHSTDAKTWTTTTAISDSSGRHPKYVTYGDGYFFVLMHKAEIPASIRYSSDGINWVTWYVSLPTAPADSYDQNGVFCYGKGLIIFGYKNYGLSRCLNFAESTSTTISTSSSFYPYAICYSNALDLFVAIGACDSGGYGGYYSNNGITWYASTSLKDVSNSYMHFHGVCYGNDRFIFINNKTVYYSLDGKIWNKTVTFSNSNSNYCLTYDDASKCFFAVSGTKARYTADGITWVDMNDLPTSCNTIASKIH